MLKNLLLQMVFLLMLLGCQQTDRLIDQNVVFEDQNWDRKQKLSFTFKISDTVPSYGFSLNLKNSMEYPYRNLYFLFSIKDSLGNLLDSGQEQLLLFSKKGKPLGASNGLLGVSFGDDYYSSNFFYSYKFKRNGAYSIEVSQNMRNEEYLSGLMLAGIKIEVDRK